MLCVYQDRVVRAASPGGFGSSLSLSGSGALALPELYEVYGLKILQTVFPESFFWSWSCRTAGFQPR